MSSQDVTRSVNTAVNQMNQNQGGVQMTNTNQNAQFAGATVQKVPSQFNVYDPQTGRNWIEDSTGRRVFPSRPMTGTQLVRINSMRNQLSLPYLNEHNVKSMSIDSASLMIDDLQKLIARITTLDSTVRAWNEAYPQSVQTVQERQAERVRREMK